MPGVELERARVMLEHEVELEEVVRNLDRYRIQRQADPNLGYARDFPPLIGRIAKQMLEQAHVAVTPGIDFDPVYGHRYLRFSYARSADDMREAVARITQWLTQGSQSHG